MIGTRVPDLFAVMVILSGVLMSTGRVIFQCAQCLSVNGRCKVSGFWSMTLDNI